MLIDATNMILGRMATVIAKKALLGESIDVINCENVLITGNKVRIFQDYMQKRNRGAPLKGPYYPRQPDRIVRRTIRGMLPYKQEKGEKAFDRVMCYVGVPDKFKGQKIDTVKEADISKVPNLKYVKLGAVIKNFGVKL